MQQYQDKENIPLDQIFLGNCLELLRILPIEKTGESIDKFSN
jgi:hypothetical protein